MHRVVFLRVSETVDSEKTKMTYFGTGLRGSVSGAATFGLNYGTIAFSWLERN